MPLQALGSHSPWDSFAECCRGMPRGSSNVTDNPEPLQVKPGYLRGGGHAFTRLTAAARLLGQQRQRCVSSRSCGGNERPDTTRSMPTAPFPGCPNWKKTSFSKHTVEKALT